MPSTIDVFDLVYQIKTASHVWFTVDAASCPSSHNEFYASIEKLEGNEKSPSLYVSESICVNTKHRVFFLLLCQTCWKCWILQYIVFSSVSIISVVRNFYSSVNSVKLEDTSSFSRRYQRSYRLENWQAAVIILHTLAFFSWGFEANWSETGNGCALPLLLSYFCPPVTILRHIGLCFALVFRHPIPHSY